jgi:hypothetical protein
LDSIISWDNAPDLITSRKRDLSMIPPSGSNDDPIIGEQISDRVGVIIRDRLRECLFQFQ